MMTLDMLPVPLSMTWPEEAAVKMVSWPAVTVYVPALVKSPPTTSGLSPMDKVAEDWMFTSPSGLEEFEEEAVVTLPPGVKVLPVQTMSLVPAESDRFPLFTQKGISVSPEPELQDES